MEGNLYRDKLDNPLCLDHQYNTKTFFSYFLLDFFYQEKVLISNIETNHFSSNLTNLKHIHFAVVCVTQFQGSK